MKAVLYFAILAIFLATTVADDLYRTDEDRELLEMAIEISESWYQFLQKSKTLVTDPVTLSSALASVIGKDENIVTATNFLYNMQSLAEALLDRSNDVEYMKKYNERAEFRDHVKYTLNNNNNCIQAFKADNYKCIWQERE